MQKVILSVAMFMLTSLKFSSSQFQFPFFGNQMNFPQQPSFPQQSQDRVNQNFVFPSQFGPQNNFAFPTYYPQNQFGQQVQTPSTTQRTTRTPSSSQQNNLRGISQRSKFIQFSEFPRLILQFSECDEYSKLIKRKVQV